MKSVLLVGLGGFSGAILRYLVCDWAVKRWGNTFPNGTFIVNVAGSFVIGFLVMLLADKFEKDPYLKQLLIVGFLGAFTTFSSYMLEIVQLFSGHHAHHGWMYLIGSIVVGLAAVLLGTYLGSLATQSPIFQPQHPA
jgi:CrcB protein